MKVQELFLDLEADLKERYDERERANIIFMLFQHHMEFDRADLVLNFHQEVPNEKLQLFQAAKKRLMNGEPVQYILAYVDFHGVGLEIDKRVLIPRPETEELVQLIIDNEAPRSIMDIGTGSGCIAIALAKSFDTAKVMATDISKEALEVAKKNVQLNEVLIDFHEHDVISQAISDLGSFDLIVSNPPYVGEEERKELAQHVIDYEPHMALFANSHDAMIFYRYIAETALDALNDGGKLYFELSAKYARLTADLVSEMGYSDVRLHNDMSGKERFLSAVHKAS